MRIDLHTHSIRSDGSDTPGELVERVAAADLDVVALSDHDTVAGWRIRQCKMLRGQEGGSCRDAVMQLLDRAKRERHSYNWRAERVPRGESDTYEGHAFLDDVRRVGRADNHGRHRWDW